jgi:hypothetical protein
MRTHTSSIKSGIVSAIFVLIMFSGCAQQFLVTAPGRESTENAVSYDLFNRSRNGKIFEAVLNDSSRIPIRLISAGKDSIFYRTLDSGVVYSIPTDSVSGLLYRQNNNGLNAIVGGFIGCFCTALTAGAVTNFNDEASSIAAFAATIGGTTAGALIGYHLDTDILYRFTPETTAP